MASKRILQQVRPVLSVDKEEARRRVLNLYKAWCRQIPLICKYTTADAFFAIEILRLSLQMSEFVGHVTAKHNEL